MRSNCSPVIGRCVIVAALMALPFLTQAHAQAPAERSWAQEKCERYRKRWTEVLARKGRAGLSEGFLSAHEAFLASGCTARADVCPRSREELDLADLLTLAAMNAGAPSTFLPFACRR